MYKRFFKRILDVVGALILLVLFLPIILLISIVLILTQRKVFFIQKRPGKHEKLFLLYKFNTMKDDPTGIVPEKARITLLGNILRKTSLDEIPQLLNVLTGKMSLIGPRPLLMEYLPLYSDFQRKRHSVLPGITGLAQVKGRNSLSWEERFKLDVYYTDNISFMLDVKILWFTFFKTVAAKDIYDKNGKMMEPFKGNQS